MADYSSYYTQSTGFYDDYDWGTPVGSYGATDPSFFNSQNQKQKKPLYKKWQFWVPVFLIVVGLGVGGYLLFGKKKKKVVTGGAATCKTNAECTTPGETCDLVSGTCSAGSPLPLPTSCDPKATTNTCPTGQTCDAATSTCSAGGFGPATVCIDDSACSGDQHCDKTSYTCVAGAGVPAKPECQHNTDCKTAGEVCGTASNKCVAQFECTNDADCTLEKTGDTDLVSCPDPATKGDKKVCAPKTCTADTDCTSLSKTATCWDQGAGGKTCTSRVIGTAKDGGDCTMESATPADVCVYGSYCKKNVAKMLATFVVNPSLRSKYLNLDATTDDKKGKCTVIPDAPAAAPVKPVSTLAAVTKGVSGGVSGPIGTSDLASSGLEGALDETYKIGMGGSPLDVGLGLGGASIKF